MQRSLQKTPAALLAGVFLCLLFALAGPLVARASTAGSVDACIPLPGGEWAELARVVDGDTLRLADGRSVRVLGINATETGRRGQPDEPYAREATRQAQAFLAGQDRVRLVTGLEPQDRYGRLLAHVYRPDGASLEEALLRRGLAFHSPVPPNLTQAECYAALEAQARGEELGIWSDDGVAPVAAAEVSRGGYQRIRGTVTAIDFRRSWWLSLDDSFTVVVYPDDQVHFTREAIEALEGQDIEIKGWVFPVRGELRVKLETPWVLQVL